MGFIDEEIAALKQSKRVLMEEEDSQQQEGERENQQGKSASLEEIIEHIRNGYLEIGDRKFHFKLGVYLDSKISLPMIENYFDEVANDGNVLALKNEIDGVSLICSYVEENMMIKTFDEFKKEMEQNLKNMGLYLEWIEEGKMKKGNNPLEYGIFKTPTAKGYTYNLIFFSKNSDHTQLILGNFNCFYKHLSTWENVIKGMINLLEINV